MRKLNEEQSSAREVITKAINDYREKLEKDVKNIGGNSDPIMIEGETSTGYYCQMMADPGDVAKILLKYDFPMYEILGEEAPQGMWDELASQFGLAVVSSFDL